MNKDLVNRIVLLDKEKWSGYLLECVYTTNSYYDIFIERLDCGLRASFVRKPFEKPVVKIPEKPDKLFEPWWDDPKAWGIEEDNKLIAVIETAPEEWSNRLRVTELWVDERYHRMGIGTALMDTAVKRAKDEGRRAVMLETQSCNESAIAFCLHYGFNLIGFDSCCYSNEDLERREVRMELGILFKS